MNVWCVCEHEATKPRCPKSSFWDFSWNAQALKAVKGVLNKLTPEKFERLLQQLLDAVKSVAVLRGLITLIFENAVAQVRRHLLGQLQTLSIVSPFASSVSQGASPLLRTSLAVRLRCILLGLSCARYRLKRSCSITPWHAATLGCQRSPVLRTQRCGTAPLSMALEADGSPLPTALSVNPAADLRGHVRGAVPAAGHGAAGAVAAGRRDAADVLSEAAAQHVPGRV
jgi:hypothetical protein